MARINLLPWRQEERLRKNKEFTALALAAAGLAIFGVVFAMTLLSNELSNQQAANERIVSENTRLDGVLKDIEMLEQQRDEMLARMKVVQDLQGRRSVPVRVWDDIARAMPKAMYLVSMKREGDVITFEGFADNANVVSDFVRQLDSSTWLGESAAPNIKTNLEAYATATQQADQSQEAVLRRSYPEDRYIQFTVTTKIFLEGSAPQLLDENGQKIDANAQSDKIAPKMDEISVEQTPNTSNDQTTTDTTQQAGGQ